MDYDLKIEELAAEIKSHKAKKVCIQLPDGLKAQATKIAKELEEKSGSKIWIWASSNFGGCDIPLYIRGYGFDMIINFGHSPYKN